MKLFYIGAVLCLGSGGCFAQESGLWEGTYICGSPNDVDIEFNENLGTGIFTFYRGNRGEDDRLGAYEFHYERTENQLIAQPHRWIDQPSDYVMVGFEANLSDDGNGMEGDILYSACSSIIATKKSDEIINTAILEQGLTSTLESVVDPKISLESLRGEYAAQVRMGIDHVDYSVSIVNSGARIMIDGIWDCAAVVDPKSGESYLYESRRKDCPTGIFRVIGSGDNLTFAFDSYDNPMSLPFRSGDMGDQWINHVPDVAVIKGIKLGDALPRSGSEIDGYTRVFDGGNLAKFNRSSIGMMGVASTNFFEDAQYIHASNPRNLPNRPETISLDDLALYGINGKVFAMLRTFSPPEDEAPRYDAVVESLQNTYGSPTIFRNRNTYEWHFNAAGDLLNGELGGVCGNRFDADRTDSRMVIMEKPELSSMSLTDVYSGREPNIVTEQRQAKLRVAPSCSYSVIYQLRPRESGVLDEMTAFAYAHDPVRTDIWEERAPRISDEIKKELAIQKSSREIAPDL